MLLIDMNELDYALTGIIAAADSELCKNEWEVSDVIDAVRQLINEHLNCYSFCEDGDDNILDARIISKN